MTASGLPTRISKAIPRQPQQATANTWKLLDCKPSQVSSADADSPEEHGKRHTFEGDLQSAVQHNEHSPNVAGLVTLPKELQLQIAEYVSELRRRVPLSVLPLAKNSQLVLKLDQRNLCLVCKKLYDVGTPLLYKDMVIPCNIYNDFERTITTGKGHPGLPHVRTLRFGTDGDYNIMYNHLYERLYILLLAIPKDTITQLQ